MPKMQATVFLWPNLGRDILLLLPFSICQSKPISPSKGITQGEEPWETGLLVAISNVAHCRGKHQSYTQNYLEVQHHHIWIFCKIHPHTRSKK